jgi:hypothetical protein
MTDKEKTINAEWQESAKYRGIPLSGPMHCATLSA